MLLDRRNKELASGVKNIDMELCFFLAGVMEGILNVVTGEGEKYTKEAHRLWLFRV